MSIHRVPWKRKNTKQLKISMIQGMELPGSTEHSECPVRALRVKRNHKKTVS